MHISGKIPITIYPTFWLFAAIIGYMNSLSLTGTVIWVAIIFVSVLFHEFGHALTALLFRRHPRIELVALGGLTYHDGTKLSMWKQFLIVLDGPLFGFLLYILASLLISFVSIRSEALMLALTNFRWANLFWTFVNLLPILPLDGGQLLRIVLEGVFGGKGFKYALAISGLVALALSLFFFFYQGFLIGALLFLMAFQSYEAFRQAKLISLKDRDETLKETFEKAEKDFAAGRKQEAAEAFAKVRKEAGGGLLYLSATQYLAFLKQEMGQAKEAFQLLRPLQSELSGESLALLHRLAFEEKDYPLVAKLAGATYQMAPSVEAALRSAHAYASLGQIHPAIGWLQTARELGLQNFSDILVDPCFDPIRDDPDFQRFRALLGLKKGL